MMDKMEFRVLIVDDDEDDFFLLKDIFKEFHANVHLIWMKDGEDTLTYLTGLAESKSKELSLLMILLDLNMPKLNGSEVLEEIRKHEQLKHIPVVVFSNSINKNDILRAYQLGANSFVRKPAGYKELCEFVSAFCKYWFEYATLL